MNIHVKEAGFGKRFLAYVIDGAIVIILTVLLFNFVMSTYLYDALGGNQVSQEMFAFATDSQLVKPTYASDQVTITGVSVYAFTDKTGSSNTPSEQTKTGYEEYYEKAWFYYTSFLYQDSTTEKRAIPMTDATYNTTFTADDYYTYFERSLMKLPDPSKITDVNVEANLTSTDSPYFKYALNDAGTAVDIHKMPVLRSTTAQAVADAATDPESTILTSLNTYMYDASGANSFYGLYGTAVIDLTGGDSSHASVQTYYSIRLSEKSKDTWISAFTAFAPFQLIFFFLIPLFRKKGETLGKMALGIAVVKIDGFNVTWKEKLIRQFLVTTLGMLLLLPWADVGMMLFALLAVVDYIVLVMSRTHQSLHDRLAKTLAVAKKESLFFDDEETMGEYASTHPEQFPERKNSLNDAEATRITQEDSILDLSTLNKNREEAAHMASFDEYEKKASANGGTAPLAQPKVNLTKEEDTPAVSEVKEAPSKNGDELK